MESDACYDEKYISSRRGNLADEFSAIVFGYIEGREVVWCVGRA
jgi:hypothetical protein